MSAVLLALALAAAPPPSPVQVELVLQGHRFTPEEITVPPGVPVEIHLVNRDSALEEFDSEDLGVEQDVTPQGDVRFTLKPLKPGRSRFMGEMHSDTARGRVVVAAPADPSMPH